MFLDHTDQIELDDADEVDDDSPGRVLAWRLDQLCRAGYPEPDALELAARLDIDLHLAADLPRRGCAPATAVAILL